MSLAVSELADEVVEWDAFVRTSPDGTPFHLTAWKQAVEETFGHRPRYLVARRQGVVEGILPLFEIRGLTGGRALISTPYAVYGGVCAASPEGHRVLVDAAAALGRQRGVRYVELRQRRDLGLGLPVKSRYVTFSRPISADQDENLLDIPRKQRRMTRQGAKYGLRVTMGREYLDQVYDVYAESVRNLGSPVFPRRLFHALCDSFQKDAHVLAVWHRDRVVAGVLSLVYEDQMLPYYGGARRDAFRYAVSDFMYWELMCHAARSGCRVFDFGRSREGTGAYDFKRHWGFEPVPLPYQYVLLRDQQLPDLSPANPRFGWATRLWKRVPLSLAKIAGPVITRYLP